MASAGRQAQEYVCDACAHRFYLSERDGATLPRHRRSDRPDEVCAGQARPSGRASQTHRRRNVIASRR
jgi:hypothetical protein